MTPFLNHKFLFSSVVSPDQPSENHCPAMAKGLLVLFILFFQHTISCAGPNQSLVFTMELRICDLKLTRASKGC